MQIKGTVSAGAASFPLISEKQMQVQNTSKDVPMTITARTNPGEVVKSKHPMTGEVITRDALPILKTAHIPAQATVELADAIWNGAWNAKSTKEVYEDKFVPFPVHDDFKAPTIDNKALTGHMERLATGKTVTVFPLRELVKSGALVIVEKPASNLSRKDKITAIQQSNKFLSIPADTSEEDLEELYNDIVQY